MKHEIRNPKSETLRNERGMILVTALLMVLMIAILSTSLFARTIFERRQIETQTNRIIAFQLAESGTDQAIAQLANDRNYAGTGSQTVSLGGGVYTAAVTQSDPNNNNIRQIVSTGYAPGNQNTSYAYQERTITTFVQLQPKSLFSNAVFAEDQVEMTGNAITDSYNSDLGLYGGTNVGANGDVGSNTTSVEHMEFEGNARVNGDVIVGPGGDPAQVIEIESNAVITGTQTAAPSEQEYQPVTVPSGLSSSGSINLSGEETINLGGGTYLFDQLKISGNARLNVLGPVTVYTTGRVEITGNGVVTTGNIPSNFIVNVVGEENVKISGNGTFYGVIYAPESGKNTEAVTITTLTGNTEIFGAIVAYQFKASGNIKVHYDEALANMGGSSQSTVSLISWQEA